MYISEQIKKDVDKYMSAITLHEQTHIIEASYGFGDHMIHGGVLAGSDAEHAWAEYLAEEMRRIGLSNVELVPVPVYKYQFNDATVSFTDSNGREHIIKPYGYQSKSTPPEGIIAEVVDVGGAEKEVLQKVDVKGKIALVTAKGFWAATSTTPQFQQVLKHGAVGILAYNTEEVLDDETIRTQPVAAVFDVPVLGISIGDADYIRSLIAKDPHIKLKMQADIENDQKGISYNVVGEIPGKYSDKRIIYSGHLDHYFRGLQDNVSSCATVMGIADAMLRSGYQPNHTMTFVLHGSEELGMYDSRYNFVVGSYLMYHGPKKDWGGNTLLDINFESSASKVHWFSVFGSPCMETMFKDIIQNCLPETITGFEEIRQEFYPAYWSTSFTDAISYVCHGIPYMLNDTVFEEIENPGSTSVSGRDHSNFDDLEVYSQDSAKGHLEAYGIMGLCVDALPVMEYDFSREVTRIYNSLAEEVIEDSGYDLAGYKAALSALQEAAEGFINHARTLNEAYLGKQTDLDEGEKIKIFREGDKINQKSLSVFKIISDALDKIGPDDLTTLGHDKYTNNIANLNSAMKLLDEGRPQEAMNDYLLPIDLATYSNEYDKEIVERMQMQMIGEAFADSRIWASGKELTVLTLYEEISGIKDKIHCHDSDFKEEIRQLKAAVISEQEALHVCLDGEKDALETAAGELRII